jgi:DNA-3-methyladenine glycosylase
VSLDRTFFERSVHEIAPELVGATLLFGDCGGVIVETEAYDQDDPACHAHVGLTPRTSVLFGPPGNAYVYLSYGIHRLFNIVCEPEDRGAAVLVRALQPAYGIPAMRRRRGKRPDTDLCSGPGKLTQALGIGLEHNGERLDEAPFKLIPRSGEWRDVEIVTGPRIGITKAVEYPWRYCAAGNPHVSRPRPPVPSRS